MNPTEDYPHLSQWPLERGPVPTNDQLVQAYALLLADRPRARPRGTHKALAVAAYLSGHYWWPDELALAIDTAMGKPEGAGNDPRNVIKERRNGLEPRGLVILHKQRNDGRETWSCALTPEGEAVIAAYCAAEDIENPVAAARERQTKAADPAAPALDEGDLLDQVESMQTSLEGDRLLREHLVRERDPTLVRQFKDQLSSLICSICSFDFEDVYGSIGCGFIEAHHLEPIGFREGSTPTSVRDFIAVCSNCHRMLHRRVPPFKADDIKAFMHRQR